jgi:hypothetical protein
MADRPRTFMRIYSPSKLQIFHLIVEQLIPDIVELEIPYCNCQFPLSFYTSHNLCLRSFIQQCEQGLQ